MGGSSHCLPRKAAAQSRTLRRKATEILAYKRWRDASLQQPLLPTFICHGHKYHTTRDHLRLLCWVEPVVPLIRTPIFSGSKQSGSWSRAAAALLIREQYYYLPAPSSQSPSRLGAAAQPLYWLIGLWALAGCRCGGAVRAARHEVGCFVRNSCPLRSFTASHITRHKSHHNHLLDGLKLWLLLLYPSFHQQL